MGATPTPRPYWTPDAPVVRLSEPERTSIAEQIRTLVEGFSLTYTWLIRQLSDEGLMTDKFEMSATLAGVRTGSKADEILRRSLSILREYQERMGPCTLALTAVFAYMACTNQISQDFMTIYAVIIAFYFGTQSQRTQDLLDSAGKEE